jgi:AraC family transcriptional regulator of adaptative response / DNA-3-methyladenine glycosylase II
MDQILGLDLRALDRARVSRDARFDGKFFIAVTSTGIYCRPICPSRTSKRANIRFYATAAAAAAAGFRPCLRCRPEAAPGTPAWLGTSAVVRRALRLIEEGILDQYPVEELASRLGIGPRHLHRLFVRHVGASPIVVAQTRRLHFAKRLLDQTPMPITQIALAAGFGSLRRFNSAFHETYGRAPRDLRRRRSNGHASRDKNEMVLRLAFRPPYDWAQVCGFLAARAVPGVERVDEHGYARTVALGDGHGTICVRPADGEHALELRAWGTTPAALFQLSSKVRRAFDLSADPERIVRVFGSDQLLAPLMKRRPGVRVVGAWDAFECAVRAVLGQQVSVAAARTLAGRLVRECGTSIAESGELCFLFPTPEQVAETRLNQIGLTTARARTLRTLATAVRDGKVHFGPQDLDEFVGRMCELEGIGEWTAHYVAMRALGEPDAFPASDLVLLKSAGLRTPAELARRAEAWRPWRAYAAMYLWQGAKT